MLVWHHFAKSMPNIGGGGKPYSRPLSKYWGVPPRPPNSYSPAALIDTGCQKAMCYAFHSLYDWSILDMLYKNVFQFISISAHDHIHSFGISRYTWYLSTLFLHDPYRALTLLRRNTIITPC